MRSERAIFVLDVAGEADFAFEADSFAQAEEFAQAPWLLRSVGQYFARHGRACQGGFPSKARPASEAEAAAYRALADEFAATLDCFFVAHLG